MAIQAKEERIPFAPTDESIFYPEEDDEPIAVSDLHRQILFWTLQVTEAELTRFRAELARLQERSD